MFANTKESGLEMLIVNGLLSTTAMRKAPTLITIKSTP